MSKRMDAARKQLEGKSNYSLKEAVGLLKELPAPKFDETIDLAISLDVDPKSADQMVRGTVVLPHGTGKTIRVLVFAKGEAAKQAEAAGADFVGSDDLVAKVEGGWVDFDVAVATPDMMREMGKLGKVLGPRGLMPSPKAGTVTTDVAKAIADVKRGKVEFKLDKQADIHLGIGKRSFDATAIEENGRVVLEAIWRARPAAAKGKYIKSTTLSSSMGPGFHLNLKEGKGE